jgi:hypothetical protein
LLLLFDFLSFKTDGNVPSKRNKQKNYGKTRIFVGNLSATDEKAGYGSEPGSVNQWYQNPDPYQKECHGTTTLLLSITLPTVFLWNLDVAAESLVLNDFYAKTGASEGAEQLLSSCLLPAFPSLYIVHCTDYVSRLPVLFIE